MTIKKEKPIEDLKLALVYAHKVKMYLQENNLHRDDFNEARLLIVDLSKTVVSLQGQITMEISGCSQTNTPDQPTLV